jgi:hypothetical protein
MRPKVGVIARVKSKFNDPDVYLGTIDGEEDYESGIRIPLGTHVFVVRTYKDGDGQRQPVISCEYGMGWLFWDELELVDEVQAG